MAEVRPAPESLPTHWVWVFLRRLKICAAPALEQNLPPTKEEKQHVVPRV